MTSNAVLMLSLVHEKYEYPLGHKRHEKNSGWTGFVALSETFQNNYGYIKCYGTGSKPVPAFVLGRIATKQLEQAS